MENLKGTQMKTLKEILSLKEILMGSLMKIHCRSVTGMEILKEILRKKEIETGRLSLKVKGKGTQRETQMKILMERLSLKVKGKRTQMKMETPKEKHWSLVIEMANRLNLETVTGYQSLKEKEMGIQRGFDC